RVNDQRNLTLHIAGENEDHAVAGAETIRRLRADDRVRIELRRRGREEIRGKNTETVIELVALRRSRLQDRADGGGPRGVSDGFAQRVEQRIHRVRASFRAGEGAHRIARERLGETERANRGEDVSRRGRGTLTAGDIWIEKRF